MGSNPSTESNYKTTLNSKNKMQMLCMQPGTTAEGYNQRREPNNSMHSSTEIATEYVATFYLNDATHGRRQQLRDLALANISLQKWYRQEELLERSPTLPRTYQTVAGNDENSPEKITVNKGSRKQRSTIGEILLSMGSGEVKRSQALLLIKTREIWLIHPPTETDSYIKE
ncbi:hypothetical protein F511_18059 [Dorcoceras hygrometricum]|uniref:Uncharacterized protein n=1 Tax=Dorcoceras hygrometricum TaxID=472368 RepID=A0A2Z7D5H0_9LAMI|nr:hypothetical protein F511_18059 [Dorcoceras hygrometricum]